MDKENEWWIVGTLILLVVFLPVFHVFIVPAVLKALAATNRFITKRVENHWIPIMAGGNEGQNIHGQFSRAILVLKGRVMDSDARDAKIVDGFTHSQSGYLGERGFEWIGWQSPTLFHPDWMDIEYDTIRKDDSGVKLPEKIANVIRGKRRIYSLNTSFTLFVLVRDVDHSNSDKSHWLLRCFVLAKEPGKFWFTQDGKGFASLIAKIESWLTAEAQKYSLEKFYLEGNDSAYQKMVAYVKDPNASLTVAELGLTIETVEIKDWEPLPSEQLKKILSLPAIERTRRLEILEKQRTREEQAKGAISALEAEKIEQGKIEERNKAEWLTLVASCGGDVKMAKKARDTALRGDVVVTTEMRSDAVKKTGVQVLGGSIADSFLAGRAVAPKANQPAKTEEEGK